MIFNDGLEVIGGGAFKGCALVRIDIPQFVSAESMRHWFLIFISKKCTQTPPPHSHPRLTNIHRDNKRNRHSPRQQAFKNPPLPTINGNSSISNNVKLTYC